VDGRDVLDNARQAAIKFPPSDTFGGAGWRWPVLDRRGGWLGMAVLLNLLAYRPYFLTLSPNFVTRGIRVS
jgi:hypothetical protein